MPKKKNKVTVGLIQMAMEKKLEANLKKAAQKVKQAAKAGAQIICMPELYRSRYFCQAYDHENFALAETIPGSSLEIFSEIARQKKVVILVPVFEKRAEGIYHNTVIILNADGKTAGMYRKMHIPDDPHFYEKFYFTPGDLGFQSFNTRYVSLGSLVCWDQWFPEAARLTALAGAQILFYPTAIGWHKSEPKKAAEAQLSGWQVVQRGHAVANEMFVAVANRVGREEGLTFWGSSFVADPFGTVMAEASRNKEENLLVECDLRMIDEMRQSWPFLRDRRIDAYGGITSRFLDASPKV